MRLALALIVATAACGSSSSRTIDSGGGGDDDASNIADTAPPDAQAGSTVSVPSAMFEMGCNQASDTSCDADELPYHVVTLPAFAIDRTEVTQSVYQACIDATACTPPSMNFDPTTKAMFPVTNITWDQAVAFCAYAGGRLPSEAEWELAARGTDGRIYPWGNDAPSCTLTNIAGCGDKIEAVGSHPTGASPYGALDMTGNVWEWTADWYGATYYASSPTISPTGPTSGTTRAYRGGSYGNTGTLGRASNRASTYSPTVGGTGLGFRCVR
jgi:formylglycine-generating enzyme required for sulfatase activity